MTYQDREYLYTLARIRPRLWTITQTRSYDQEILVTLKFSTKKAALAWLDRINCENPKVHNSTSGVRRR
ncbi:hypothetical protein [Caudoviricetes sp.]|nr:hypothetical protein [Caudoviricetes sp.]